MSSGESNLSFHGDYDARLNLVFFFKGVGSFSNGQLMYFLAMDWKRVLWGWCSAVT